MSNDLRSDSFFLQNLLYSHLYYYIVSPQIMSLPIEPRSSRRISRLSHSFREEERIVTLSICDASVGDFGCTSAVWFFNAPKLGPSRLTVQHLELTLRKTLDAYPHFCGHVRSMDYNPDLLGPRKHLQRYGRLEVCYGGSADVGCEFVEAVCSMSLEAVIPAPKQRTTQMPLWNRDAFAATAFSPPLWRAKLVRPVYDDLAARNPPMIVQITTFACGGLAVGVKFTHSLADAHTLNHFMQDWASMSRAKLRGLAPVSLSPVFNPRIFDAVAGEIDAPGPNPAVIALAQQLPRNRFDWWISDQNFSGGPATIPAPLQSNPAAHKPEGVKMPWDECDLSATISHYIIHFTKDQVQRIWEGCYSNEVPASRHDAITAHVWAAINRARGLQDDEKLIHCDVTLGLRKRLSPPLGDALVGSPILLADVALAAPEACGLAGRNGKPINLLPITSKLHSVVAQFTPSAIGAHFHQIAYQFSPQRIWHAFMGLRHVIVTSWVHGGVYQVNFTGDDAGVPRYVELDRPDIDGCIQIVEAPPLSISGQSTVEKARHWCDDGVDVYVHIEAKAMEKLVKDPLLLP